MYGGRRWRCGKWWRGSERDQSLRDTRMRQPRVSKAIEDGSGTVLAAGPKATFVTRVLESTSAVGEKRRWMLVILAVVEIAPI